MLIAHHLKAFRKSFLNIECKNASTACIYKKWRRCYLRQIGGGEGIRTPVFDEFH